MAALDATNWRWQSAHDSAHGQARLDCALCRGCPPLHASGDYRSPLGAWPARTSGPRQRYGPAKPPFGLEILFLFPGAVVTESIPSSPGEGRMFIDSITIFDYTILMGILLITAVIVELANLVADVLFAVVDPRIKYCAEADLDDQTSSGTSPGRASPR